jgi:two-component system, OmpR family, phosphate regulon sensor histidine kinase PhoR
MDPSGAGSVTVQRRAFALASVLLLAGLALSGLVLHGAVQQLLERDVRTRILSDIEVGRDLLQAWDGTFQVQATRLAELLGYRVTLLTLDGTILGESGLPGSDPELLEDHADRPEVQAALAGEVRIVERRSASLGDRFLVVAAVAESGGEAIILRISRPTDPLTAPLRRGLWLLVAIGFGGALLAGLGGRWVGAGLRREADGLESGVRRMAEGDFRERPRRGRTRSELDDLAGALGDLADEMQGRLSELERDRDELRSLVDAIAEGVVALTSDARVLRMNRAAVELLEVTAPSPFAPVGTLVRNPELRDHLEASVLRPLPPREISLGDRYLRVSTHAMEGGGAVITFLDVTGLRRMAQVRRDFVANASHELKTPLTVMRGFAEALLEEDPPEPLRTRFLESIRSNALRLQHLVDDLLDLSRLESGGWKAAEEEVGVAKTARDAWKGLLEGTAGSESTFAVEGDGVALADGQALHQIFRNLLDNARRYTGSEGRITVRIVPQGPSLRVSVADTGVGVPSAALPRIFERFYRVDAGRDRTVGGTGLGLAIVRHLVQSMGGEVWAESELGKGTTVHFTVPRVEG